MSFSRQSTTDPDDKIGNLDQSCLQEPTISQENPSEVAEHSFKTPHKG